MERLLASGAAQQEVVLLHGWASSREVWRPLLRALRPWANITLLDLPGLGGEGEALDLEALLQAILDQAPSRAVYIGWSLGGQLATLLAAKHPQRVLGLVSLASNPRFTADKDWPGVDPRHLQKMSEELQRAPERTLRRFEALQVMQQGPSSLIKDLAACRGTVSEGLSLGLQWLASLDNREILAALQQPQLHLLGAEDALVPASLEPVLSSLLASSLNAEVLLVSGAGHALPIQSAQTVAEKIQSFLSEQALLGAPSLPASRINKSAIADSFSRAAASYDSVASLQRDVGKQLLRSIESLELQPRRVLDLGCGTGFFQPALRQRFPQAHYVGLDIALGMLSYARRQHDPNGSWLAGDAEQLPLAENSVDLVFSSLAIQWCQQPEALFAELGRVLRPGGLCVFSTLGPKTLHELRSAWAAVDSHQHVNQFLSADDLLAANQAAGKQALRLQPKMFRLHYGKVRELFDELKTLGARNMNKGRSAGLTGRKQLSTMMQAYEGFRQEGLLPASYEVYFGVLEKQ